jgi:hypothetical protein
MTKMTGQVGTKRLFLGQIGGVINHDQLVIPSHAFADALDCQTDIVQLEHWYAVSLEQSQQISKIETRQVLVLVAIGSHQNL